MKYRVACCGVVREALQHLKGYFNRMMIETDLDLKVDFFPSGETLLQRYQQESTPYHVLFLDLQMPGLAGLETARKIREMPDREVLIILMGNDLTYLLESLCVQPFQYLVKPVSFDMLQDEMQRVCQYIRNDAQNIVFTAAKKEEIVVPLRDILYIQKEKRSEWLNIAINGRMIHARGTLDKLEKELVHHSFVRISRFCIINMKHIFKFNDNYIELDNGSAFPASRGRLGEIKQAFSEYILQGWHE